MGAVMRTSRYTLLLALVVSSLLSACGNLAGEPDIVGTQVPVMDLPQNQNLTDRQQAGLQIFLSHCASCHGEAGHGDGVVAAEANIDPANFHDPAVSAGISLEAWTQAIREGRVDNMMPTWQGALSEDDIVAVADYTYSLSQTSTNATE